jgi:hypothetical protein
MTLHSVIEFETEPSGIGHLTIFTPGSGRLVRESAPVKAVWPIVEASLRLQTKGDRPMRFFDCWWERVAILARFAPLVIALVAFVHQTPMDYYWE